MWDFIGHRNLIGLQRIAALKQMGREAHELHQQGYSVEADRVLDEMNARRAEWDLPAREPWE